MLESIFSWMFSTDSLVPHGFCLLWRPDLVWTHVVSDATIAISYFTIPLFLIALARGRRDLIFRWPLYLFGLFILLCGTTHVLSIVAFWVPIYGFEGLVKVACGLVSIATAVAVWPILPTLLALPSHDELQRLNQELEDRVSARTRELAGANTQLTVLLHEVHHRVKNNLQIIASMLRLQQRYLESPSLKDALNRSIGRIHAMSLVHEALYGHANLAHVEVGDYLRKLVEFVVRADPRAANVAIDVQADATTLRMDQSVPLALVANEVITNALKHGFPDQRQGRIHVSAATQGTQVTLLVEDDGVGQADAGDSASSGFGMQIVQAMAAQLGGTAKLQPTGRGMRFELTFARQALPEPEPAPPVGLAPRPAAAAQPA